MVVASLDDSLYNLSYADGVVSLIKYTLTRAMCVTKIFNNIRNTFLPDDRLVFSHSEPNF